MMKWVLILMACFACCAAAADITGTWKGTADTPNGPIERTFVFKVDGAKVSGETTSAMMGKSVIEDGKLEGETVTFHINVKFQDNDLRMNYKGQISGDQIKFHVEAAEGGFSIEYVAKKVS